MKALFALFLLLTPALAEAPKIFAGILKADTPTKAQIGIVLPPQEINKYVAKIETAARKDLEWFEDFSKNSQPGVPLPFHEKLGLSQEEYDKYLALWAKREFKPSEDIQLLLRKSFGEKWTINATGRAGTVSTLRYDSEKDVFRSPNGILARIDDINTNADSPLGAWTGKEWRLKKESGLGRLIENFAVGEFTDTGFGVILYRVQEFDSDGRRLFDKSLAIRFPMAKVTKAK